MVSWYMLAELPVEDGIAPSSYFIYKFLNGLINI